MGGSGFLFYQTPGKLLIGCKTNFYWVRLALCGRRRKVNEIAWLYSEFSSEGLAEYPG
jgi:hypothetical protein